MGATAMRSLLDESESRFPLDLGIRIPKIRELYRVATARQWDPLKAIPWDTLRPEDYTEEQRLAAAGQLRALLCPGRARAGEHPHRPHVAVVSRPADQGGVPVRRQRHAEPERERRESRSASLNQTVRLIPRQWITVGGTR